MIIDLKPQLKTVFRDLLPLAVHWKTIGTLLGVDSATFDKIEYEERAINDCLRKMLDEWLKRINPLPTWAELIDAVNAVDKEKAQEIGQRIAK